MNVIVITLAIRSATAHFCILAERERGEASVKRSVFLTWGQRRRDCRNWIIATASPRRSGYCIRSGSAVAV